MSKLKYITGTWPHLFADEKSERAVRVVLDAGSRKLLHLQVQASRALSGSYRMPSEGEFASVEYSLLNANAEVFEDPEMYGLEASEDLPGWVNGGANDEHP